MTDARQRKISAVVVWDFSRFARSLRQLVDALDRFHTWGVSFISLREGIDTDTANGRLMFGIFASLAEFERELIRERIYVGPQKIPRPRQNPRPPPLHCEPRSTQTRSVEGPFSTQARHRFQRFQRYCPISSLVPRSLLLNK
jgi:DNA invertase Pin-like site-specific DNA recombinase